MSVELSRPVAIARIGPTPLSVEVSANPDECQALAARMRIPAILALTCAFVLRREAGGVRADARLQARVTRVCVVSLDEFEADIVLKDQRSDLAVLRIKGASERFPTLEFANSDELQVGDVVLAIGDPFGVGQTVTHGIVSAVARSQVGTSDYQFFIQTDAAINPGIAALSAPSSASTRRSST